MCGICNIVNCIRRNLCSCGCRRNNGCGCARNTDRNYREEPCMNVICANRENRSFTPCCDNDSCRCNHHRNCD